MHHGKRIEGFSPHTAKLEVAVQHIEAGKADIAQHVVVKAEQVLALGSAGAAAAQALEGFVNKREGRYVRTVGKGSSGHDSVVSSDCVVFRWRG